jgi:hypothetical protein
MIYSRVITTFELAIFPRVVKMEHKNLVRPGLLIASPYRALLKPMRNPAGYHLTRSSLNVHPEA